MNDNNSLLTTPSCFALGILDTCEMEVPVTPLQEVVLDVLEVLEVVDDVDV